MIYREWMTAVDREVREIAGVSIADLADQPLRAWFDDGVDPAEAAEMALTNEDFPW